MHPNPLTHFTPEELAHKVHALLEDWASTTLSPIGLCRTHDVTLVDISAIRQLPMFSDILNHIEEIQHHRRPHIEQGARDLALDRLCYLAHQTPTSAASCKEIRLATKAILDLVGPTPSRPSESVTPPMQSADSETPPGHAHDESSNRGGGVPESPSQRAPSVSDGVFHEPEASAPGPHPTTPPMQSTSSDPTQAHAHDESSNRGVPAPANELALPTLTPTAPNPRTAPPPPQATPPTPPAHAFA